MAQSLIFLFVFSVPLYDGHLGLAAQQKMKNGTMPPPIAGLTGTGTSGGIFALPG